MKQLMFVVALLAGSSGVLHAAEPDSRTKEETAILEAVQRYVAAFNKADAKALAGFWSPEAVYTNPVNGEQVIGREAIEKQFATIFADAKDVKLIAATTSVEFISPNVAVEHGSAQLLRSEQIIDDSEYTAIYVKRDGSWLLDRVTEEEVFAIPSHYEHLKELEWLVGRWVDQDDHATVVTDCHWTKNNNFLVRSFTIQVQDRIDMSGLQIIGWDPANKQIRSWVFDSDGGFGQGTWEQKENRWYIDQTGVLNDGRKSTSVNILTKLDDNTFALQSVSRTVGGELLPNIDEVIITKE